MFEDNDQDIDSGHAVNRIFELVREGNTEDAEFARLDALIQARLHHTYGNGSESIAA